MKIRLKVFEDAMRLIAPSKASYLESKNNFICCCPAIQQTCADVDDDSAELQLFCRLFSRGRTGLYWQAYEPGYTSRIIALQLAVCVAREENKKFL